MSQAAVQRLYGTSNKEKKDGYNQPFKAVVKGNETQEKKEIWDGDEVPETEVVADDNEEDDREEPDYEILYKQSVGAEDVYMNMGFKDLSSMSCDKIVIKIKLPDTPINKVDVTLTSSTLLVRCPKYKLYLELPRQVQDKEGKAEFDSKKSDLKLTIPIVQRSMKQVIEEDY
uniref:PIH1D1/2/3 CS-like domain-containing protein n=2 Tax=Lotharella globosa TaxID=91324 RepID=A0A7S4DYC6_9EUKA